MSGKNGKKPVEVEDGLMQTVLELTEQRPYAAVGAALAVGYVVGGGLFSGATARILGFGLRLAALPGVQERLVGLLEDALPQEVQPAVR